MNEKEKPKDFIQAFANGLDVIRAFDAECPRMTLSEVAARCGMTRAMARRLLWTLEKLGYVENTGRLFGLRPKVLELGFAYLSSQRMLALAQPLMERLAEQVHESCSMAVLDGTDIVYVLRIPTKRIMKISLGVGSRLPAYATSMGRVLLGALDDAALDACLAQGSLPALTAHTVTDKAALKALVHAARAHGCAIVNQELELGLCSAAVPILGAGGRPVAAINIGTLSTADVLDKMDRLIVPALRETAADIMAAMARQAGHY